MNGDGPGPAAIDPDILRAEQDVLGAAMASGPAAETVVAELCPADYARPGHADIHRALHALVLAGRPASEVTVAARLAAEPAPAGRGPDSRALLDTVGGGQYLRYLAETASTARLDGQIRAVATAAARRDVAERLDRAARLAANPAVDRADIERDLRGALERLLWGSGQRWPEPRPLAAPLPELPAAALPGTVRRIVEAVAATTQTPPDLAAFAALATLSAATRGNWEIRVRPGWTEQTALYLAALADSGERKSAVVAAVGGALKAVTNVERHATADRHAAAEAHYRVLEARAKAAQKRAAEAGTGQFADAMAEAEELAVALANTSPPRRFRLTCGDVTPEELARLMEGQGGPMAVLTAEGGLLGTLAGRYSKDGSANLDLVLQAYNAEQVQVDRVSREPLDIDRPFLALGFIVQPDVIQAAAKVREFTTRGLLPRMLFAWPASALGTRGLDAPPVPPEADAEWVAVVGKVFAAGRDAATGGTPGTILLDDGARAAFDAWRGPHEGRLHPDLGDLADMAAWASKLPGTLVRIAALFALAERPGDSRPRVTGAEMAAALELAPYLISHAREVLTDSNGRREQLRAVLEWIKRTHRDVTLRRKVSIFSSPGDASDNTYTESRSSPSEWTLSVREAHRGLHSQGWVRSVDDVEGALADLEDLGYVRRLPPPPPKGGRPGSPRYQPNPRFLAGR